VDKKNTFLGILFVAAAIACLIWSSRYSQQAPPPAAVRQEVARQLAAAPPVVGGSPEATFSSATQDRPGAQVATLENHYIQVHFTNFGGAIRNVALRKYPASLGGSSPYLFNELHDEPMLGFVNFPGLGHDTPFAVVSQTDRQIVYRAVVDGSLEVTRTYTLPPDSGPGTDPYQLRCETTFLNVSDKAAAPLRVALSLGTTAPINAKDYGRQLATGYSTGSDQKFILRSQLESSGGFLGMGAHDAKAYVESPGPITWAAVKNQFFSAILTPDIPCSGLVTRRVKLLTLLPDTDRNAYGITGAAEFDLPGLAPKAQTELQLDYYVGPNEYPRLANDSVFKADQDKVMQFGFFKFFSELLLTLMIWIRGFVPNWGVAIILTTLTLKTVCLPLTLVASRSAKRMQKIQPLMQALKEKYKDNPAKLQTAQVELFKKHKVNPLGGCIPMLLPMPFFFGFFYMLQNAAELRFAPFLWAHDLSAPDTVGYIFGIPINVLPLIFVTANFVQMMVMPQPTVDNAQARMMKFMPLMLLWIYYGFSCALSLYSTVNAVFTIGQQLVVNRMKDPEMDLSDGGAPAKGSSDKAAERFHPGRPVKNVTPGKRKH
jgi:YidC/Oxa1 family membrane protein insertase